MYTYNQQCKLLALSSFNNYLFYKYTYMQEHEIPFFMIKIKTQAEI